MKTGMYKDIHFKANLLLWRMLYFFFFFFFFFFIYIIYFCSLLFWKWIRCISLLKQIFYFEECCIFFLYFFFFFFFFFFIYIIYFAAFYFENESDVFHISFSLSVLNGEKVMSSSSMQERIKIFFSYFSKTSYIGVYIWNASRRRF